MTGLIFNSSSILYTLFNNKGSTLTSYGSTKFEIFFFRDPENASITLKWYS